MSYVGALSHTGTVTLQTRRLVLRPLADRDVPQLYRNVGGDPEVHRYLGGSLSSLRTPDGVEALVDAYRSRYDDPRFYCWAIEFAGEVIGMIDASDVDDHLESCQVRGGIGSAFWGGGLMTEALDAVLAHLFVAVGMHRVFASCHAGNKASERVLEKAGMAREGRSRDGVRNEDGSFDDLLWYGVTADQWADRGV